MSNKGFQFVTAISNDDFIVRDHRVHGVRIIPGVTFLDTVVRAFLQKGIDPQSLEISDVLFHEPIATSESINRKVLVDVKKSNSGWSITVKSCDRNRSDDIQWNINMTASASIVDKPLTGQVFIDDILSKADRSIDLDVVYECARRVDIQHLEFMKGLGEAYRYDGGLLAKVHLSQLAQQYLGHFYLHPAYLDAATICCFLLQDDLSVLKPAIPIFIKRFNIAAPLGKEVYVHVRQDSSELAHGDILYHDIELYDEQGNILCCFERIGAKHIRSTDLITRLIASSQERQEKLSDSTATVDVVLPNDPEVDRKAQFESHIAAWIAQRKKVSPASIQRNTGFYEQGLDSSDLLAVVTFLEQEFSIQLYPTLLFEHNTLASLAEYLQENVDSNKGFVREHSSISLPEPVQATEPLKQPAAAAQSVSIDQLLLELVAGQLGCREDQLDANKGFYDQGLQSNHLLAIVSQLEERFDCQLYPTLLFEYSTIGQLAGYLKSELQLVELTTDTTDRPNSDDDIPVNWREATGYQPVMERVEKRPGVSVAESKADLRIVISELAIDRASNVLNSDTQDNWLIELGQAFDKVGEHHYVVDQNNLPGLEKIVQLMAARGRRVSLVYVAADQIRGMGFPVFTLTRLIQSLMAEHPRALSGVIVHGQRKNKVVPHHYALGGFAKSLFRENPNYVLHTLKVVGDTSVGAQIEHADWILTQSYPEPECLVRELTGEPTAIYREHFVATDSVQTTSEGDSGSLFKSGGVYLITGGQGGVARQIVPKMVEKDITLILCGRSEEDRVWLSRMRQTACHGAQLHYIQCDITEPTEVSGLIQHIMERFGTLQGLLHTSGVIRDSMMIEKTSAGTLEVIKPKVVAAHILDKATASLELDWFVMFSSMTGTVGNAGQSDYAYANAYLDAYAEYRNNLQVAGRRHGRAVSIAWPYWADGGMSIDAPALQAMEKQFGLLPMPADIGWLCMLHAMGGQSAQINYAFGDQQKIADSFGFTFTENAIEPASGTRSSELEVDSDRSWYGPDDIAIIGVNGSFPEAEDLTQFYENLKQGRDSIQPVPQDRWLKPSTLQGGFLADVDKFDSLFFNISPREAEIMDPQERLFMECTWKTIENAGYCKSELNSRRVGVYVGAMWSQYQLLGSHLSNKSEEQVPTSFLSSIANRVSYFFDFKGPSLTVDTMCSSSITSIHMACQAIREGECELAVAGGVNLSLHPDKYHFLGKAGFLSSDGRCRSFGDGGDGYVPGEGVGAVLLKPLAQAEADGDHIYGVIKATSLNHGGKASGYNVPTPVSQSNVIRTALEQSKVSGVNYIEAHGTGTSLGDPIEINGLERAFNQINQQPGECAIGSVKSNIGHLEAAAGIASLCKVILQLQHQQLFPSIHSETLNTMIAFDQSRFNVQRELSHWPAPIIETEQGRVSAPRSAGISSFGAGGSNGHLVIQEYVDTVPQDSGNVAREPQCEAVFVLSAKSAAQLKVQAQQLLAYVHNVNNPRSDEQIAVHLAPVTLINEVVSGVINTSPDDIDSSESLADLGIDAFQYELMAQKLKEQGYLIQAGIQSTIEQLALTIKPFDSLAVPSKYEDQGLFSDVAFTLQTGREAFSYRLALISGHWQALEQQLTQFINDQPGKRWYSGRVANLRHSAEQSQDNLPGVETLQQIAEKWVNGDSVDWSCLHASNRRRVPLPTYPFLRKRHWVTLDATPAVSAESIVVKGQSNAHLSDIHPLLQRNSSLFDKQVFKSTFSENQPFIRDHRVEKSAVLSGACILEIARQAGIASGLTGYNVVRDVAWIQPTKVAPQKETEVTIELRQHQGAVHFEGRGSARDVKLYSGVLSNSPRKAKTGRYRIIRSDFSSRTIGREEHYRNMARLGFEYGPSYRAVEEIRQHEEALEVSLICDHSVPAWHSLLTLLDGAFQSIVYLTDGGRENSERSDQYYPASIDEILFEHFERIDRATAYVTLKQQSNKGDQYSFDLSLKDSDGKVIIHVNDFTIKRKLTRSLVVTPSASSLLFFSPSYCDRSFKNLNANASVNSNALVIAERGVQQFGGGGELFGASHRQHFYYMDEADAAVKVNDTADSLVILLNSIPTHHTHFIYDQLSSVFEQLKSSLNRIKRICLITFCDGKASPASLAFSAFVKTLNLEGPVSCVKLVQFTQLGKVSMTDALLSKLIDQELCASNDDVVVYDGSLRQVRQFNVTEPAGEELSELKLGDNRVNVASLTRGGHYLITGGLGDIGYVLAKHLAEKYGARLSLTGRSRYPKGLSRIIRELESLGGSAQYISGDCTDLNSVQQIVTESKAGLGPLQGVLHCAGIKNDQAFMNKTWGQFKQVIDPKVKGAVYLDIATQQEPLEHFILFSSLAGVAGNPGQSDYAYGNNFLDHLSYQRNRWAAKQKRSGVSLSINWPFWLEGGMTLGKQQLKSLWDNHGLQPISNQQGIEAFEACIGLGLSQVVVAAGDRTKIEHSLNSSTYQPLNTSQAPSTTAPLARIVPDIALATAASLSADKVSTGNSSLEAIKKALLSVVSEILKIEVSDIDIADEFSELGFESISLTTFAERLSEHFDKEVTPALFYDFHTIESLAEHLNTLTNGLLASEHQLDETAESIKREEVQTAMSNRCAPQETGIFDPQLSAQVTGIIARLLKIEEVELEADTDINEYGFDSIVITQLCDQLNNQFKLEITPTLFYEATTINQLVRYISSHQVAVDEKNIEVVLTDVGDLASTAHVGKSIPEVTPVAQNAVDSTANILGRKGDIAIVGMSGKMPGSKDLETFWHHLESGEDLITEVPESRWDWKAYFGNPQEGGWKTQSKFGGFMPDIDSFDPLFFGISPKEARLMDPQQRLILQAAWHAVEDAGEKMSALSGSRTAVFLGVATSDYDQLGDRYLDSYDAHHSTGVAHSITANRLSYLFNLTGPSEPVDTACSSSLVAIHRAVQALQNGDCNAALVGGVNAMLTPKLTLSFDKAGMLSADGRCKAFDDRANGYVRGEGVGVFYLKRLKDAIKDKNPIHAVIKSTAVNHGGKANSLTAPNPSAQADLLVDAYQKAGFPIETLGYLEAHGTGTKLGDPIEIEGIKQAYARLTEGRELVCGESLAIGSVKSNVGHLETAAGVAGLFKTVLSLKHKTLPGTVHFQQENPYLKLDDTHFYIVGERQPWAEKSLNNGDMLPRRAGLSSFGFGGVNAHIVLEEHRAAPEQAAVQTPDQRGNMMVLSAKTPSALRQLAEDMLRFLRRDTLLTPREFESLLYTLQVGRECFEERCALPVVTMDEAIAALQEYLASGGGVTGSCYKKSQRTRMEDQTVIDHIQNGELSQIAARWVTGAEPDWTLFYSHTPSRIHVPVYPFASDRYWLDTSKALPDLDVSGVATRPEISSQKSLKPLSPQRMDRDGAMRFAEEHVVNGAAILPAVANIAFVASIIESGETKSLQPLLFQEVVWNRPIDLRAQPEMRIVPKAPAGMEQVFSVVPSDWSESAVSYTVGVVSSPEPQTLGTARLDIAALRSQFSNFSAAESIYRKFSAAGIDYGPGFQTIQWVRSGSVSGLGLVRESDDKKLSPSDWAKDSQLLDGAIQCAYSLFSDSLSPGGLFVPHSVEKLLWYRPLPSELYVHYELVKKASGFMTVNYQLMDQTGEICVEIQGLLFRKVPFSKPALDCQVTTVNELLNPAVDTERDHSAPDIVSVMKQLAEGKIAKDDVHRYLERETSGAV